MQPSQPNARTKQKVETEQRVGVQGTPTIFSILFDVSHPQFAGNTTEGNSSPSCFAPHKHHERGLPPSHCVSFCADDVTRRGKPFPGMFLSHRCDKKGFPLSQRVS